MNFQSQILVSLFIEGDLGSSEVEYPIGSMVIMDATSQCIVIMGWVAQKDIG